MQAVKNETSGHFEYGLVTILRCAENPANYFAKVFLLSICVGPMTQALRNLSSWDWLLYFLVIGLSNLYSTYYTWFMIVHIITLAVVTDLT